MRSIQKRITGSDPCITAQFQSCFAAAFADQYAHCSFVAQGANGVFATRSYQSENGGTPGNRDGTCSLQIQHRRKERCPENHSHSGSAGLLKNNPSKECS
jgi:hypothetical protein